MAKPVQANEVLLRDDFEINNLDNWTVVRNKQYHHPEKPCFFNGVPAQWEIIDGKIGININSSPCTTEIIPKNSDLAEINDYQFEFEWYFPISTHMDRNVLIKWQDPDNWYGIHIFNNKLWLQKVINGQSKSLYNNWGYYDFEPDQSYSFKISVINDLITVWINDQQVLETLDRPPFLENYITIGFQAGSGDIFHSSSFFDNLIVKSLDQIGEKKLNVPFYKQHDPEWKNREYDHANQWSTTPTIARWGCALTSVTMILDYYNINLIPLNLKLSPTTLNFWLKNQPDGFIGEGLINWLAVTRLTQIMSDQLDTPILEYQRLEGEIENAINDIDQNQPVILQLPGHFLVANGYNTLQTDLFIKDPAYNYSLLSQHQNDLLSVRSFKPSHTDLSYLLVVHDLETEVTLINKSDSIPTKLNIYSEYIHDYSDTSTEQTKIKIIQSLAKPTNGEYLLKIKNKIDENKKVEIYAYDTKGKVTILTQEVMGTKLFSLDYSSNENSELTEITNKFTLLRDLLRTLYESGEITTKYAYLKLDQLASFAENDESNQDRYQKLIIKTAQKLKEFIPYSTVIISLAPSS